MDKHQTEQEMLDEIGEGQPTLRDWLAIHAKREDWEEYYKDSDDDKLDAALARYEWADAMIWAREFGREFVSSRDASARRKAQPAAKGVAKPQEDWLAYNKDLTPFGSGNHARAKRRNRNQNHMTALERTIAEVKLAKRILGVLDKHPTSLRLAALNIVQLDTRVAYDQQTRKEYNTLYLATSPDGSNLGQVAGNLGQMEAKEDAMPGLHPHPGNVVLTPNPLG